MSDYTWSYSSLKQYQNCPRQYHEIKVLKNYTIKETEQMRYGTEVHKALEEYVRDGTPLLKNYERFKPVVDELNNIGGKKYPEYEMALKKDGSVCDFHDTTRWVRGIVDLLIVDGENAFIVDYKTGSNKYPDRKQLRLMSLMTFAHFPEVKHIKAGLLFVMHNTFITEEYPREKIEKSWERFKSPLTKLENSYDTDVWMPNPTPLCGWCQVKSCEFHKIR